MGESGRRKVSRLSNLPTPASFHAEGCYSLIAVTLDIDLNPAISITQLSPQKRGSLEGSEPAGPAGVQADNG